MVDQLTFIGVAASIVGIIEALAKTVSTLHELHSRWKEAGSTFINLIAQLTALKAELSELKEWMDTGLDEGQDPYHQLVIDLELNIACCKMLAHKMDAQVLEIYQIADKMLDSQNKVKLMVRNGTFEGLQKMVERQTSVLTFLLTVCHCKALSEQQALLEKSNTRKMIRRIKDDTSSLYVERESMSLHTRASQYSFGLELFTSKVFERISESILRGSRNDTVQTLHRQKNHVEYDLDLLKVPAEDSQESDEKSESQSLEHDLKERDLFEFYRTSLISRLYEKPLRGSTKNIVKSLHRLKYTTKFTMNFTTTIEDDSQTERSRSIDHKLKYDWRRQREECRLLVLGDDECGQIFLKQSKIFQSHGFTTEELQEYKSIVRSNVKYIMNVMNSVRGEAATEMDEITEGYAQVLSQEWTNSLTSEFVISKKAAEAVQGLWASEEFSMLLQSGHFRLPSSAEYFIQEINRVSQEDYIPTESDVLRAHDRRTGIREYRLNYGSLSLNMFDVSGQRSDRRKWMHQFENVISIIYFVDLGCYNEMSLVDPRQNKLMESLEYFDKVVNSRWFMRSSFILFLSNIGSFRGKLGRYPLSRYFPDYTGGYDFNRASKYIIDQFLAANPDRNIYPHICDATDYHAIRLVTTAVQQTIILYNLWGISGLRGASKENVQEKDNNDQKVARDSHVDENMERGSKVDDGEDHGGERQMAIEHNVVLDDGEGPQM